MLGHMACIVPNNWPEPSEAERSGERFGRLRRTPHGNEFFVIKWKVIKLERIKMVNRERGRAFMPDSSAGELAKGRFPNYEYGPCVRKRTSQRFRIAIKRADRVEQSEMSSGMCK
ncbi:hypothetical protein CBL_10880 [Carabus blaptoides fortunei]